MTPFESTTKVRGIKPPVSVGAVLKEILFALEPKSLPVPPERNRRLEPEFTPLPEIELKLRVAFWPVVRTLISLSPVAVPGELLSTPNASLEAVVGLTLYSKTPEVRLKGLPPSRLGIAVRESSKRRTAPLVTATAMEGPPAKVPAPLRTKAPP